jgi:tetratricopeptide (TPR) repeat protein
MKLWTAILTILLFPVLSFSQTTADEWYNKGINLKNDKKSAEALLAFKETVKLRSDHKEAWYEMGWCQNDTKDYVGAIASLRIARSLWPDVYKIHFELGYAFEKINSIDSAINNYNECLQITTTNGGVYKQLGTIYYNKNNYSLALQHFASYIANAKQEITDYLFWYRKGFMENAEKKYTDAKESLRKSLMYKTDYTNTYLELGFACNKLKEGDDAINWFNEALKLDAKSHIPYNGIAEVYRDTHKDMDMAISWYQKSLAVKTDERKACFGMGYCLNNKARYSEAATYLQKAIQQEPTYTAAYVELGYSQYMLSNNTDALQNLNKAISLNPKNENARYYAGLVYINQKDKTMAQKMVDELKALSSKNAETLQEKVNKL